MRKRSTFILLACLPFMVSASTKHFQITIDNPLPVSRVDAPIVIHLGGIAPGFKVVKSVVTDGNIEIPCQIDDLNRDDIADEVAFVVDVPASGTRVLHLTLSDEGVQTVYEPRVWAGFKLRNPKKDVYTDICEVTVPGNVDFYNMVMGHGPMFESELVGYRVYFNPKQTLDPYGKFNKGLELEECLFYPNDEQLARGFGDDVLMVGNSLGVGAFKGCEGNKTVHIDPVKTRTERLVAAGPVRTIAEVEVDGWDYQGSKINMLNRYTLYAGHRDLQIDVEFDEPLASQTFATGAQRIMGNETHFWSDHNGLTATWGRHWPVNDTVKYAKETVGIATYVPRQYIYGEAATPDEYIYKIKAPGSRNLRYHTMFTSCKETFGPGDKESWFGMLPAWKEDLENPLRVIIEEK